NFHFVTGSLDHERAAACVPNCTHQGSLALGDQAPAPTGVHPVAAAARDAYHSASLRIRIARAVRTGVAHAEARVRGALLRALHHRDLSVSGAVHVENPER